LQKIIFPGEENPNPDKPEPKGNTMGMFKVKSEQDFQDIQDV